MLPSRGVFAVRGPFGNTPRQFTAIVERSGMHQDDILPWLNAWEHTSATSRQESGPLHKPARKDEEHGDQPAPFALVDQHEPFAQVARHAPFGQSDCSMGTGREASSHIGGTLARGRTHQELACQPARRAESPGHKKTPLRRAAPSPQTTGANQIRPES